MNKRIMIAGTNSGCGKTTVTLAIMSLLKERNLSVCGYKCGPDYIDPMFHRRVLSIPSHNLDPYFSTKDQLCAQLERTNDISVIEGVMGYYDGIGTSGKASSYTVASETLTPVILVINARGMYTSTAAIMKGFKEFHNDSMIKGVIFNNVNAMVYSGLAEIARSVDLIPLGYLPSDPSISISSRHLGLITAAEINDLSEKLARLCEAASHTIDIDGVLELADTTLDTDISPVPYIASNVAEEIDTCSITSYEHKPVIAIANDEAFSFLYEETLDALISAGAEIKMFSPIHDDYIPIDADAIYIPGGYPELYVEGLSQNISMRNSIREHISAGIPTIAECGGFMYLHNNIDGYPMVGFINADSTNTDRLQRFGYVTLKAKSDSMLLKSGESLPAHEFHYYESTRNGEDFTVTKASTGKSYNAVFANDNLYAGFPHLYLASAPTAVKRFVSKAAEYHKIRTDS